MIRTLLTFSVVMARRTRSFSATSVVAVVAGAWKILPKPIINAVCREYAYFSFPGLEGRRWRKHSGP